MARTLDDLSNVKITAKPKPRKKVYDIKPKRVCSNCGQRLTVEKFYKSYSELSLDGYSMICKDCLVNECLDDNNKIDAKKMRNVMRQINRPYLQFLIDASIKEGKDKAMKSGDPQYITDQHYAVKVYMKNLNSLPQYASMTYEQGLEQELIMGGGTDRAIEVELKGYDAAEVDRRKREENAPFYLPKEDDEFEVTPEIVRKFGEGYSKREYRAMVEKYDFLSQSYVETTNLHSESLITYVRYKVKEEIATADGKIDDATSWAALATKAAEKAKINPNQLSASGLQGDLNSFSELLMAVEQAVDIIPILPQFKFRPNDAVDFTIWCYVNYIRRAEGKPMVDYEEIYKFYDERKKEYIAQYGDPTGIFANDPTESNRKNIKKFITLPKDYGDDDG